MLMPETLSFRLGSLRPTRESTRISHISIESIDAMFQRFTIIMNNLRANVVVLPYCDAPGF
jgi:hypothetical protein